MSILQPISSTGLLYDHIVGTGGIGSGIFFALKGNDTLGREESRMATLLPYKDYCKQHIILHYISVFLGASPHGAFESFPIGKIGNDETGKSMVRLMNAAGMTTDNISIAEKSATLFSVCYQYPDHAGGNITTAESASNEVSPADISGFFENFDKRGEKEIILAAPEVPVETRISLLEFGKQRGSLNVASVLSSETDQFKDLNGFALTDMLFINLHEAEKIAGAGGSAADTIVLNAIKKLLTINPDITVFITSGAAGVYCYSEKRLEFFPALPVEVISTAGAGDAFLAGTIAGICCGLPLFKQNKETASLLSTATELGILIAGLSVTSQHTIHPELNPKTVYEFIMERKLEVADDFMKIFKQGK